MGDSVSVGLSCVRIKRVGIGVSVGVRDRSCNESWVSMASAVKAADGVSGCFSVSLAVKTGALQLLRRSQEKRIASKNLICFMSSHLSRVC